MKKTICICIITFLFSGVNIFAQSNNTLLWEISGKGLKQPSYLFGTFHLLCPDDLILTDAIKTKLKATKQLALELDFDDPNMMTEMQQGMVLTNGKTTKDYLNKKDYQLVSQFFKDSLGVEMEQLATIKPFLLATFIYPKYLGCQPASWEMTLVQLAQAQQYEVLGLETPARQLAAIDIMSFEDQAKMLTESISEYNEMKNMFAEMVSIYKEQDVEKLYNFSNEYFNEYNGMEQAMLEARNREWIPIIEKWSKEKPTFYAVGAGHLGGKTGVIALLRDKGYKVTPVANVITPEPKVNNNSSLTDLISRKWRMHESIIPQAVEDVLDNVRTQNPDQAKQLEAQKPLLVDGLRASTFAYNADGTYEISTFGQLMTGTWKLSDDQKNILRVDQQGEESVNEIVEITAEKMVVINSKKRTLIYVPK